MWQVRRGLIAGRGALDAAVGGGGLGLQTSLTGFWSFENTSWTDDTGNGSTLTATGSPTSSSSAPAMVGNYLSLPGSAFLSCASNTNVSAGGSSFSVQAWAYVALVPGEFGIVNKAASGFLNQEWGIGSRFTSSNVWAFTCVDSSAGFTRADGATVSISAWTHLVATYDGATKAMTLYVNGSSSGTNTLPATVNGSASIPFQIGNTNGGTGISAGSHIDQVGFWKGRILSAGDVTALYNSGSGLSYAAMA